MKLAAMQPYIFPYLGYFQLMNLVDKFIILDDVTYINKGWINRNRILVSESDYVFTIPLKNKSQNTFIKDLKISKDEKWKNSFLKTIELAYKNAPFFNSCFEIIRSTLSTKSQYLIDWHLNSFSLIKKYLKMDTKIFCSSESFKEFKLKGESRILEICKAENVDQYYNTDAGMHLYTYSNFEKNNIKLSFLKMGGFTYNQKKNDFIPNLSIIDVMMFNDLNAIDSLLYNYEIIKKG